jgi:hypothetical protein
MIGLRGGEKGTRVAHHEGIRRGLQDADHTHESTGWDRLDFVRAHSLRIVRRRSKIAGWGVFAAAPIPKNTRIIDYAGELISTQERRRRERVQNARGEVWCFIISRTRARDAAVGGNLARFINHACKPNCWVEIADGTIWIRASRRIRPTEELSYDYSLVPPLGIPCRCRPGCRNVI